MNGQQRAKNQNPKQFNPVANPTGFFLYSCVDGQLVITSTDMLAPPINHANAKEMQLRSALARKRNREAAKQAENLAREQQSSEHANTEADPYVEDLACAQRELLAQLRTAESAKDKAALAQALKNLRETYHLATGLAKPGVRKPERVSTRQHPGSQSSGPELPPDTTSGSGSTGQ